MPQNMKAESRKMTDPKQKESTKRAHATETGIENSEKKYRGIKRGESGNGTQKETGNEEKEKKEGDV